MPIGGKGPRCRGASVWALAIVERPPAGGGGDGSGVTTTLPTGFTTGLTTGLAGDDLWITLWRTAYGQRYGNPSAIAAVRYIALCFFGEEAMGRWCDPGPGDLGRGWGMGLSGGMDDRWGREEWGSFGAGASGKVVPSRPWAPIRPTLNEDGRIK